MRCRRFAALVCLLLPLQSGAGEAALGEGGLEGRVGAVLPLDAEAVDENGLKVKLSELLDGQPALLNFSAFRCATLCGLVPSGLASAIHDTDLRVGRDVRLLTVSLDPEDTPALARTKKRAALARLGLTGDYHPGWRFLTARPEAVQALTRTAGVRFRDGNRHPAAVLVVTPGGKLSRTFSGISFSPAELKDAIAVAGRERTRRSLNQLIFDWLPSRTFESQYGIWIAGALQWLGLVALAGAVALGLSLTRRRRAPR